MATAHFTTIPCEPNTASVLYLRQIHPGTNNIVYGSFEVLGTQFSVRFY